MKRVLFAIAALAIASASLTPANAQVWLGADPGGVGVQVGPIGAGVGPDYWGYHHRYRDYAYSDCRRERIVTPSGSEIIRTRCD